MDEDASMKHNKRLEDLSIYIGSRLIPSVRTFVITVFGRRRPIRLTDYIGIQRA